MRAKSLLYLTMASVFLLGGSGCESNMEKVRNGSWGSNTETYAAVFAEAFEGGQWSEVDNGNGEKYIQFSGKISRGLHNHAVRSLAASDSRILFQFACEYLAALNKDGRAAKDRQIQFDVARYPIQGGAVSFNRLGSFISEPRNRELVSALNTYYLDRYWEAGSPVLIQWQVYSGGKVLKVVRMSNRHWDDDALYRGKPEAVMRVIYEYARQ